MNWYHSVYIFGATTIYTWQKLRNTTLQGRVSGDRRLLMELDPRSHGIFEHDCGGRQPLAKTCSTSQTKISSRLLDCTAWVWGTCSPCEMISIVDIWGWKDLKLHIKGRSSGGRRLLLLLSQFNGNLPVCRIDNHISSGLPLKKVYPLFLPLGSPLTW